MRLIDADEFKKYIKNGSDVAQRLFKTDEYKELASEITEAVLWDVDEQPTVFDLKDLKEMKERTFNLALALKSNSHALWTSEQILYELWNCNILDDEFLDDEFYNLKKQEVQNETI